MINPNKGSYIILAELSKDRIISVGKLGPLEFEKGYYAYVGSALNGLKGRIQRHLSKTKSQFWHIDYLLKYARVIEIFYKLGYEREECTLALGLAADFKTIDNFGSSDCKCNGHLFYSRDYKSLLNKIISNGLEKYNYQF